jgi:hypothetical protein
LEKVSFRRSCPARSAPLRNENGELNWLNFQEEVVAVAGKQFLPEEEPSSWVEAVSLVVDALGLSTILFLTGILLIRYFTL